MLRDANHQQVIQKFSFIQSLNLSRGRNRDEQKVLAQIQAAQADNHQPHKPDLTASSTANTANETAAIVTSSSTTSTINANWYQSESDSYSLNLAEIIKCSAAENITDSNYPAKSHNYLGKIMFALACSYCMFVLWWLFGHQGERVLTMLTRGQQITISKSDAQFIDYMERSLAIIDRQVEANTKNSGEDNQVVYVPVYTPNPVTPSIPQISNNNLPTKSLRHRDAPQIPQPTAIEQPEALKIPAPPPLPAPTSLAETNPPQITEKTTTAIAKPPVKHTLIGILELGEDKSAALIKVNGQTRRFWLGEQINSSGWILESVANQTAQINYQGQVRSIAVGETF